MTFKDNLIDTNDGDDVVEMTTKHLVSLVKILYLLLTALYDNLEEDAPQQRLPIPVEDLKSYYLRMHADSDHLFDEEFKVSYSIINILVFTKALVPLDYIQPR